MLKNYVVMFYVCCLVDTLGGVHYQRIWLDVEVKIMWIYSMVTLVSFRTHHTGQEFVQIIRNSLKNCWQKLGYVSVFVWCICAYVCVSLCEKGIIMDARHLQIPFCFSLRNEGLHFVATLFQPC